METETAVSEIIFCRTRYNYETYQDYFKLIDLSGFRTVFVDEIEQYDAYDNVFIITPLNGEWDKGIQSHGKVILQQLEWDLPAYPFRVPEGIHEVWCSDSWQAERL